tara:strand:- start:15002 stop:16108 length:1107 start_codon:yes stop_codon:yes gene_type:complete
MKVVYIGNYKDGTGWANACINNMLALDSAGVDVVPRAINFNGANAEVPERILELESNTSLGSDICIQHTLPHLYVYDRRFKNIGFYVTETHSFSDSMWQKSINLMDEAWVPNKQMVKASQRSGVKVPIRIAPHSLDMSKYDNVESTASAPELEGTFNFCFVGEMSKRKNIEALLRAFHTEFHPSEPVNILFKVHKSGYDSDQSLSLFRELSSHVKRSLKTGKKYKEEVVIAGYLEHQHLHSLMKQAHCFVMPSFGEAWCIPAMEAMALGMPVIYTQGTGMDDFCVGFPVESTLQPCYEATDTLDSLYTADSKWMEPDVSDLAAKMRIAYQQYSTDKKAYDNLCQNAKHGASSYDTATIGRQLKELLDG